MAAENDNTTSMFELEGRKYEVPAFVDLDINDWEIVYDECGVVLADFLAEDPAAKDYDPAREEKRLERIRNPRLEKSFIMVALRRARPDDDLDTLRKDAGHARLIPYLNQVNAGGEADPPTSATTPDESSSESSDSSSASSSPSSDKSSETPEAKLASTGTDG